MWRLRGWLGGRLGWLPPWVVGYVGVILLAIGAVLLLAGAGSCVGMLEDASRRLPLALQTVVLMAFGVAVMRLGVAMLGRDED